MRLSILALTLALAFAFPSFPVVAADVVSGEFAVTPKVYEASPVTAPAIAVGATKSYAVWTLFSSKQSYGAELAANGRLAIDSRIPLASAGRLFAAGDLFYTAASDNGGDYVRRLDNGATLRGYFDKLLYNGSRILLVGKQTLICDTNLNVVVPQVSTTAGAWTVAGDKFFGITGSDSAAPHLVAMDGDGNVQTLSANPNIAYVPTLTGNGSELLHVWMQADRVRLYGQRYSLNGTALSGVFDVGPATGEQIQRFDVAAAGSDFIVAWSEHSGAPDSDEVSMYTRRVTGSNATAPALIDRAFHDWTNIPIATGGPAGVFMTWMTRGTFWERTAMIRRLDVDFGTQPLFLGLPAQTGLTIASDGTNILAGWVEDGRVHVGRLDGDGVSLDGTGHVVAPDSAGDQHLAGLLFDGVNYLVLFQIGIGGSGTRLYARLVRRDGTFGTNVLAVSPPGVDVGSPTMVWTGTTYRAMWRDGSKILYADISTSGLVLAPVQALSAVTGFDSFFLLWGSRPLYIASNWSFAEFLDDLSTFQIPRDPSMNGGHYTGPAATNGTSFLISWRSYSLYEAGKPFFENLWLARWDMNGKLLDLPLVVGSYTNPIGITGTLYLIPFTEGSTFKIVLVTDTVKVAKVDDHTFACRCLDDVTEIPGLGSVTSVATAGDRTVIAYVRSVNEPGLAVSERAFIRFLRAAPPPRHRAVGR